MMRNSDRDRRIRLILYDLLVVGLYLLQTTKGVKITVLRASPDYLIFFLAAVGLFEGPYVTGSLGFLAGLLLSLASPWAEGLEALYLALFGVACGWLAGEYLRPVYPSVLLCGSMGILLRGVISYVFYYRLVYGLALWPVVRQSAVQLGLSALASPLVFLMVRAIHRRFLEDD